MKKILLVTTIIIATIATIGAGAALSLTSQSQERQENKQNKAQQRKTKRALNDSLLMNRIRTTLENQTFYFDGTYMQTRGLDRYMLRAPYNYVELKDDYLRVQLPYFTSVNTMGNSPSIIDFESTNFTYQVTELRAGFTVVINVKEVTDTYRSRANQSGAYRLVLQISCSGSSTGSNLALTPNFTSTINYSGSVRP
ncbi:MAG: DUF4251 domain-containing protein [Mucinivorans sp.]